LEAEDRVAVLDSQDAALKRSGIGTQRARLPVQNPFARQIGFDDAFPMNLLCPIVALANGRMWRKLAHVVSSSGRAVAKISHVVAACAVALLTACGGGHSSTPPTAPTRAPAQPTTAVQLNGYVDDTTLQPVSNAAVEVLDGPETGRSTVTDGSGRFTITGQFNEATRFRATKGGYQAAIQAFQPAMLFFLGVDAHSGNSATLTVEADPACTELPTEVRRRTYEARIAAAIPGNTSFAAHLAGASLDSYFNSVYLRVVADGIMFDLSDNGIEDEVGPEAYLFVGGVGVAHPQAGATTFSATLSSGLIDYCVLKSDPGAGYPCTDQAIVRVQCRSANNRLTVTWR